MEAEYYEDGKNRFLRIRAEVPEKDSFKIRMINQNPIESLLRLHLTTDGDRTCYDYNITGLLSLKEASDETLQGRFLYTLVFSLERLSRALDAHMLVPEELLLDPRYIYLQMDAGMMFFCYCPGCSAPVQEGLQKLMEYFLMKMDPVQEEEVLLLYGLYQRSRLPDTGLATLASYWRHAGGEDAETADVVDKADNESRPRVRPRDRGRKPAGRSIRTEEGLSRYTQEVPYLEDRRMGGRSALRNPPEPDREARDAFSTEEVRLYEDLGLNVPGKEQYYAAWKNKAQEALPEEIRFPDDFPGKAALTATETAEEEDWLKKIQAFFKAHLFEVLLAAVLVAALIIWLVL